MTETMLLCLGGIETDTSLGLDLDNDDLELLERLAQTHGFRVSDFRSFDKPPAPQRLAQHVAFFPRPTQP